jgi:hypothetical protein
LGAWKIGAEDQSPRWCIVPSPFGDLGEEVPDCMDPSDPVCDGDRLTGDAVGGGGQRGDERFDVSTPVQFGQ